MSPAADSGSHWPAADAAPAQDPADRPRDPAELLGQLRDRLQALPPNHPSAAGHADGDLSEADRPGTRPDRVRRREAGAAPGQVPDSDGARGARPGQAPDSDGARDAARDVRGGQSPDNDRSGGAPRRDQPGQAPDTDRAEPDGRSDRGRATGTPGGWPGSAATDWSGPLGGRAGGVAGHQPWFAADGALDPWFTAGDPGDPWFAGPADGTAAGEPG